jgi:diguanylate cyclase (GGDEF)-like protein
LLSGSAWGTASFLITPGPDGLLSEVFVLIFIGGLVAGSIGAYAVDLKSFAAFVIPTALPTAAHFFSLDGWIGVVSGGMGLTFVALMSLYAMRLNQAFLRTFRLQFENERLVAQLDTEKCQLQRLKGDLELRVAERTAILEVTNRQLEGEIERSRLLRDKLIYQATHDALTSLINRSEFERRLQRVLDNVHHEHHSEHVLCYLDLDQFKVINDTSGHAAGDALLQQVTEILKSKIRKRDTLARLGGDEFGILMEHCSLGQANRTASNLYEAVRGFRFAWEDKIFRVSFSMGVVPISPISGDLTDVLQQADAACYEAKDQGRDRIHIVYKAEDAEVARRRGEMGWVERIGRALEDQRFTLVYQPQATLTDGSQAGLRCEILLRLIENDQQVISPAVFMRSAERYNMAMRIDQWVVQEVLATLHRNARYLDRLDECSINLSGQSVGSAEFLEWLVDNLTRFSTPPEKLCFEITEATAMINFDRGAQFISRVRELGCRVALDDFGTGLCSFAYLRSLPVDYLKIDGSLVQDIDHDPVAFAMVRSINEIGHLMGKKTVAEFAGNDTIIAKLQGISVDFAQGFGVSHPRAIGDMFASASGSTGVPAS